jgi:hypothetical protein
MQSRVNGATQSGAKCERQSNARGRCSRRGLVYPGGQTGLSPALLSKIERRPLIPTLLRIALVFGIGLECFFAGAREKPLVAVTREGQRVELRSVPARTRRPTSSRRLITRRARRRVNGYYAEFHPVAAEKLRPHDHAGVEFICVTRTSTRGCGSTLPEDRVMRSWPPRCPSRPATCRSRRAHRRP